MFNDQTDSLVRPHFKTILLVTRVIERDLARPAITIIGAYGHAFFLELRPDNSRFIGSGPVEIDNVQRRQNFFQCLVGLLLPVAFFSVFNVGPTP